VAVLLQQLLVEACAGSGTDGDSSSPGTAAAATAIMTSGSPAPVAAVHQQVATFLGAASSLDNDTPQKTTGHKFQECDDSQSQGGHHADSAGRVPLLLSQQHEANQQLLSLFQPGSTPKPSTHAPPLPHMIAAGAATSGGGAVAT